MKHYSSLYFSDKDNDSHCELSFFFEGDHSKLIIFRTQGKVRKTQQATMDATGMHMLYGTFINIIDTWGQVLDESYSKNLLEAINSYIDTCLVEPLIGLIEV